MRRRKALEPEAILAHANEKARLVLDRGEDEAEAAAQALDAAELRERMADEKAVLSERAAKVAQAGLDARRAAQAATAEAVRQGVVKAEESAKLGQVEAERRRLLETIEELTAAGRLVEAAALEQGLVEIDLEAVRGRLVAASEAEAKARDRASLADVQADQCQAESRELRRQLEEVEQTLRPEFEKRAEERQVMRVARLYSFDARLAFGAEALTARTEKLRAEEERKERKAMNASWPDAGDVVVEVDRDRRISGLHLPITTR